MKISLVVPAFNEEKRIAETLRRINASARAFRARGWDTEVLVCDNNSTDRTADLAREAGAIVVFEAVNQIGRARNRGAASAGGDWLVFVDADTHPSEDLFRTVAETIAQGRCLAGGSTLQLDERTAWGDRLTRGWNRLSRSLRWMAGSFIFCESAAFREIGGFDESLFAGEEIDLSRKLKRLARKRGLRIVILRDFPPVTSSRKMRLYSVREHLKFFIRATLLPRRTLQSAARCYPWYDGRR